MGNFMRKIEPSYAEPSYGVSLKKEVPGTTSRRGVSLLELSVVIVLMSILIGISMNIMQRDNSRLFKNQRGSE